MVCGLSMILINCSDNDDPTFLSEVRLSQSYVGIPQTGGSATIRVNASTNWSISSIPNWLTVSPASGGAGESQISFSADATADGRSCELLMDCGGVIQRINIIQGLSVIPTVTVAEILSGPEKTYRVTGTVTSIANTSYGNWYMNDGTSAEDLYIYGTLDKAGKDGANNSIAVWGIEVGDEVTVEGPMVIYNGTVELKNVTVVKINKSLIKVDSLTVGGEKVDAATLPLEGGEVTAHISCKGDGINVDIPQDAKDWLVISSVTSNSVTFRALPNLAGDRSTTVTLKTYNGGKEYTSQFSIAQAGAIIDVTVAEFLAAEVGETTYRMQGIITALYDGDKQGKSFYIKDFSGEALVYRAEGFLDSGIKVGDVVTVLGKRGAYKDSPQMVNGSCELLYAVTPVTIAEFLTMPDDKNVYYMVTGTISSLLDDKGAENDFGNMFITDGTNELYVYGCYPGWGATGDDRKFLVADNGLQVGDEITMIGYKDTYKGVVELCKTACFSFKKANQ